MLNNWTLKRFNNKSIRVVQEMASCPRCISAVLNTQSPHYLLEARLTHLALSSINPLRGRSISDGQSVSDRNIWRNIMIRFRLREALRGDARLMECPYHPRNTTSKLMVISSDRLSGYLYLSSDSVCSVIATPTLSEHKVVMWSMARNQYRRWWTFRSSSG